MRRRIGFLLAVLAAPFLLQCSGVPPLATEPGKGPSVRQIVNHINCELASIIAANPSNNSRFANFKRQYQGPVDERIEEREAADGKLKRLLPHLQEDHFVASVLLTMDTTDSEGVYPNVSFIQPITSSLNRSLGIGASVSGSQQRNVSFGYSIDLANVAEGCRQEKISGDETGITGTLSLADVIADGLTGLDSTERVNVYNSGGPVRPAFDAYLHDMDMALLCSNPGRNTSGTASVCSTLGGEMLRLTGNVNFAPSTDPQQPGNLSFAGKGIVIDANGRPLDKGDKYIVTLQGTTIDDAAWDSKAKKDNPDVKFTLSGSMTRDSQARNDPNTFVSEIGFSPSLSLVGTVHYSKRKRAVESLTGVRGIMSPSSETQQSPQDKRVYNIHKPNDAAEGAYGPFNQTAAPSYAYSSEKAASPKGGGGGSAGAASKSASGSTNGSTQFGSLIQFSIGYGLNGGPNWNLARFKGPGGGSGASGSLLGLSRQQTATLQLTFVAACNDDNNYETIDTFWKSLPKCNGTQQGIAAAAGANMLYQAQPFATLR
jgi:hypothetical protein